MNTPTPTLPSLGSVKGAPEYIDPETVPDGYLHHIRYALARGISASVMAAAAWTSVDSREAAEAVFDDQCGGLRYHKLVAERLDDGALILPRLRIDGTTGVPQVRLDNPRPKEDGDGTIKFETPGSVGAKKAGLVLAPSAPLWWAPQSWVNDPAVPVIISEGPSRELAMVTAAIREQVAVLPVTLTGVAMGTGRRKEEGEDGKTRVVERWLQEDIATLAAAGKGRDFYIAFDHDVLQKKQVHAELGHLVKLLREAGANVRVIIPPAQGEDTSAGLDDALAAGTTLQQMVADSLPDLPSKSKPRRSTLLATLPEDAQADYEDRALDGEVLTPEAAEDDRSSSRAVGAGRVIDMTPAPVGDVTSVDSLDQVTESIGLPSTAFMRGRGMVTWRDAYAPGNMAMGAAALAKDYFRHLEGSDAWIRYDGRRWVHSGADRVRLFVEGVIRAEREDAVAGVQGEAVGDEAKDREAQSARLLNSRYADDVVSSLKTRLEVNAMDLDADPDVLNVLNGTLDLRRGELRPHNPDDLISKLAPVAYRTEDSYGEEEAERLAWARQAVQAVVNSTGEDEPDIQSHLELIMGQGITGHAPYGDPSLVVMEGGASNGKTSRFSLLKATLGDYCAEVTPGVFKEDSTSSNEREALWGARIVIVEELTTRGGSVAGSTLKTIVGKEEIQVRPLYSKWIDVPFVARIFGSTNDQLRIIDDDDGIWRRLQRVLHPYKYVADPQGPRQRKRDVRMETIGRDPYVREEWLRLLLRGAMRWYQMPDLALPGSDQWPDRILTDTAVWREDENPVGRMIGDLLEPCEGAVIPLRDILDAANAWRRANDPDGAARGPWTAQTIRSHVIQSPVVRDQWGVETKQSRMTAERERSRSAPMIRDYQDRIRRMNPRRIDNREVMAFGMAFSEYVLDLRDFRFNQETR